jgi:hypothetical protein
MELDGYCEDLQLAFEHHGAHHFGRGRLAKFARINPKEIYKHDTRRKALCETNGIRLFIISEITLGTPLSSIASKIFEFAIEHKIPTAFPAAEFVDSKVDLTRVFSHSILKEKFESAEEIAKSIELTLTKRELVGPNESMEFRCNSCRFVFRRTFYNAIRKKQLKCPFCKLTC